MTPTERKDRRLNIEGELKQARQVVGECIEDVTRKQEFVASAELTLTKARERLAVLEDECRKLADEAREDFLALLHTPMPAAPVDSPAMAEF